MMCVDGTQTEQHALVLLQKIHDYLMRNGDEGLGECFHKRIQAIVRATYSTEPIYDGVKVIAGTGQVLGEVRTMRDGIHYNAVPFDDRPNKEFDEQGRAISYLISGW